MYFSYLHIFVLFSTVFYIAFDLFERKRIKDEREELIHLKTLELSHKITVALLAVFAAIYWRYPDFEGRWVLISVVLSLLYTEVLGKFYFRKTM